MKKHTEQLTIHDLTNNPVIDIGSSIDTIDFSMIDHVDVQHGVAVSYHEALKPIEDFLCAVIDPLERQFSVRALELNYGYKHVDINYIESCLAWDGEYSKELIEL